MLAMSSLVRQPLQIFCRLKASNSYIHLGDVNYLTRWLQDAKVSQTAKHNDSFFL